MSEKAIINYIKKSLSKGYSPEQIRDALINAGHSPHEVDVLIRSTAYKKRPPKKLILIAIILIAITLVLIGLILLLQEEETPNIQLTLLEKEITKGKSLLLKTQIINPAEKTVQVELEFMVFAPSGPLLSSKKKIITTSDYLTEVPEQLELDIPPGTYKLMLTGQIGTYTLTKEAYFNILAASAEEKPITITTPTKQRIERPKECVGDCDDFNACTLDKCVEGECVHEPITPCCGNKICENRENYKNCPIDCNKAKEKPKARPETADLAVRECEKIATITEKDNCLENAAREYWVSNLCDRISQEIKKDSCYMNFALEGDFAVCDKISNPWTKRSCESLASMSAT